VFVRVTERIRSQAGVSIVSLTGCDSVKTVSPVSVPPFHRGKSSGELLLAPGWPHRIAYASGSATVYFQIVGEASDELEALHKAPYCHLKTSGLSEVMPRRSTAEHPPINRLLALET
jgi:hypothetical protein